MQFTGQLLQIGVQNIIDDNEFIPVESSDIYYTQVSLLWLDVFNRLFRHTLPIHQLATPFTERAGKSPPQFLLNYRMGDCVMRYIAASNDRKVMRDFLDFPVLGLNAPFPERRRRNFEW